MTEIITDIEVLKQHYAENKSVKEISDLTGLSEKSVIARLSNAGVYKKKVYLTKQGKPPVRKSEYVERIADLLDVNVELLDSLEKANKLVLEMLVKALDLEDKYLDRSDEYEEAPL